MFAHQIVLLQKVNVVINIKRKGLTVKDAHIFY